LRGRVDTADVERPTGWIRGDDNVRYRFNQPSRALTAGRVVEFSSRAGQRAFDVRPVGREQLPQRRDRIAGFVAKLNASRGWGFIAGQDGASYFFHATGVLGVFSSLVEGQTVLFDVAARKGKIQAVRVTALESGA
jgi:CspA family cold shock protein